MDIGLSRAQQANQHVAELAIRSAGLLLDFQLQTARDLLELQARSAALFGVPDCSSLFNAADDRTRRIFSEGAEHVAHVTRRANETMAQMNRQLGRLVEQQAVGVAEQMRQGIEQIGRHAEQGLQQARTLVEQGLDELERSAQEARREANEQPGWQQGQRAGEQGQRAAEQRPGGERGRKQEARAASE